MENFHPYTRSFIDFMDVNNFIPPPKAACCTTENETLPSLWDSMHLPKTDDCKRKPSERPMSEYWAGGVHVGAALRCPINSLHSARFTVANVHTHIVLHCLLFSFRKCSITVAHLPVSECARACLISIDCNSIPSLGARCCCFPGLPTCQIPRLQEEFGISNQCSL